MYIEHIFFDTKIENLHVFGGTRPVSPSTKEKSS